VPAVALVDPDRVVWAARQKLLLGARNDFHKFGPAVVRNDQGEPIRYAPIHLWWIAHINYAWSRGKHAGIFAPFGHGKSSALSCPLLAYLVGHNPQERIKIVCAGDSAAALRMQSVKQIMESPLYGHVFPEARRSKRGKWTDHMMVVERRGHAIDPTIEARGVLTKATGARATTILFDDIVDAENSTTPEKRAKNTRLTEVLWMSRLEPGGRALAIATPWDLEDTSYQLRARPDFCWLEQRVKEDLSGYEQDAHNVGLDYAAECSRNVAEMLADP